MLSFDGLFYFSQNTSHDRVQLQLALLPYETLICELPSALKPHPSLALTSRATTILSQLVTVTQLFTYAFSQQVMLLQVRYADLNC